MQNCGKGRRFERLFLLSFFGRKIEGKSESNFTSSHLRERIAVFLNPVHAARIIKPCSSKSFSFWHCSIKAASSDTSTNLSLASLSGICEITETGFLS
jgi:hypothetical protein